MFSLLMITLVELGAVFWVGAHCWLLFVLPPPADQAQEQDINQGIRRRFERRLLPFTLLMVLLANTGVLLGHTTRLNAGSQLLTTLYGQVLDIKTTLVALLLLTSAAHVFLLRPRLKTAYQQYTRAARRLEAAEPVPVAVPGAPNREETASLPRSSRPQRR